jgi:hypothetical protein
VRAKPVTESYATKEGGTITRQTGEVEWTAIKRTHDGRIRPSPMRTRTASPPRWRDLPRHRLRADLHHPVTRSLP